jgi:hypothetical protein
VFGSFGAGFEVVMNEVGVGGGGGRGPERVLSAAVQQLAAGASDEQLAWMVGPDRRFYSAEALEAASMELARRRLAAPAEPAARSFNIAAFAFGPLWYFYNGLIGRGLLISAVWLGAFLGLGPVAHIFGVPGPIWVAAVALAVGAYCGRFAERDKAESATQERLADRRHGENSATDAASAQAGARLVAVAEVGCKAAGEQARAMLEAGGIAAIVEGRPAEPRDDAPTRVLVAAADEDRARELVSALLASAAAPRCDEA